jgi:hypothetical protein
VTTPIERIGAEKFALAFPQNCQNLAWLLGAGASAAAGIPTGYDMIIDFKTRLFCEAVKIRRREVDTGDPLWLQRITAFFDDAHGMPAAGDADEYAALFEAVYPKPSDRRTYIEKAVRLGKSSYGHRVLAALIASGQVPCLFTTNFDPLVERATTVADELLPAASQIHLTVADIDSAERAERCLRESSWPLLTKLHGDYKEERLKNTSAELAHEDERLLKVMVGCCARFGLVVAGYSGRDASVMAALTEAIPGGFPAGLFWITRPGTALLPSVAELLAQASTSGVVTRLVEVDNFDEFASSLDRQATLPAILSNQVRSAKPAARVQPVALPTVEIASFPVLRCSALPLLEVPTIARRLVLVESSTTLAVRNLLRDSGTHGVVACQGPEVAAFGQDEALVAALAPLGARIDGEITLDPHANSWVLGLLYDALTRALARRRPLRPQLRRSGHSLVVAVPDVTRDDPAAIRDRNELKILRDAYGSALSGTAGQLGLPFAEAVRLRLEWWLNRWWCVFDPFTWVEQPRRTSTGESDFDSRGNERRGGDPVGDWRRERWATRRNSEWASILEGWARLLAPDGETTVQAIDLRGSPGLDAQFTLTVATAWSRPGGQLATTPSRQQ